MLIFIFTYICCQSTIMLTYDTPQSFVLTPSMYQYADSFIIEMWGGGGAGGCQCWCHGTIGGGSGSYIKALIHTYQNNFNVTVGYGGNRTRYDTDGGNGGYTQISNTNIDLIAEGGYNNGTAGKVLSSIINNDDIIYMRLPGQHGFHQLSYNYGHSSYAPGCNGGSAPYGGTGGSFGSNAATFPGGGGSCEPFYGSWCANTYYSPFTMNELLPSGANGGVIFYFAPRLLPTSSSSATTSASQTPSPSATISASQSSSSSVTISASQSYISASQIPRPSVTISTTLTYMLTITKHPINYSSTSYTELPTCYNSITKEMLIDIVVILCIVSIIIALLILFILIVYCIKSNTNNINIDINCSQKVISTDDI
jgi:hypothetical protein